jgi:uncharacterized protein (DUF427 family)
MSLVTGRGPLSKDPAGWFSPPVTAGTVFVEPHPRRVKALRDGQAVIDTERALLVHRPGQPLSYAFPVGEIGDLPGEPVAEAPGFVQVPWDAVEAWLEEGRRLVHYPPNPYHRVDCRPTDRRLHVTLGDEVLVDTTDTVIVFETSLEPRLYVAPALVRTDLLQRSETSSYCNYKGYATYWSAVVESDVIGDVAWTYEEPLPETLSIRGHFSFDPAKVDVAAELPRP